MAVEEAEAEAVAEAVADKVDAAVVDDKDANDDDDEAASKPSMGIEADDEDETLQCKCL